MPAEFWTSGLTMAVCVLAVAGIAAPVGLAGWLAARRFREPILPRPRSWHSPWMGLELVGFFFLASFASFPLVNSLLIASGFYQAVYGAGSPRELWAPMMPLWSAVFFIPPFVGVILLIQHSRCPRREDRGTSRIWSIASRTALAVIVWLLLHPTVAVIHFVVTAIFTALGWPLGAHPLEAISWRDRLPLDQMVLLLQASVMAPVLEELLFRGLLLPWLLARRSRPGMALVLAPALALVLGLDRSAGGDPSLLLGPVLFAMLLLAGGLALHRKRLAKRRSILAVYSSAALFAVVHSNVWPTPIPLFVLGLGLGWLALRTRGFLAPAIVHGLFNAASVLFVLHG